MLFRATLRFTSARAQLLCLSRVGSPAGLLESVILLVRGQPLTQNTSFYLSESTPFNLGFQETAGSQQYSEEQSSFYLSAVPLGPVALILPKRRPSSGLYQMAFKGHLRIFCVQVCVATHEAVASVDSLGSHVYPFGSIQIGLSWGSCLILDRKMHTLSPWFRKSC